MQRFASRSTTFIPAARATPTRPEATSGPGRLGTSNGFSIATLTVDLHVTLFTTPDWRELSPLATRKLAARIPVVRDRMYLTPVLPKGTMCLGRHPEFASYLVGLPRTEVALHGLHHVHPGRTVT